jgi:hypothetical protein
VKAELLSMTRPRAPEPARELTGVIHRDQVQLPAARRPRRRGLPIALQLFFGAGLGLGLGYALTVLGIKALDLM